MATTDERLDALMRDVRYLRDRQEILDCVNLYGRGLDRLDATLIRDAYHPDAIDHHGPFLGDIDAFVPFAIDCEAFFQSTHHGVTSHNCEIDGDTAHAESYVYFFAVQPGGATLGAGYGRYLDRFERRDGRWAIVVRRLVMDCTFEVPRSGWLGPDWDKLPGLRDRNDLSYQRPLARPTAEA
ncbi:MAG: hypothetical protein JWM75_1965 [Sphingomonas bacterium]|nr:hypothetical protein [Sphingomonas bacterium]